MFDIQRVEIEWGGRKLTLETGRMARQADAAVYAQYGETSVLATVVAEKSPKPGIDFFPLTVNYQEKTFAAGKIPGGFFKREGRPTEKETLTSRLIDRPIRPLFVEGFKNETQVVVDRALARHGERPRHRRAGCRLRGARRFRACRSSGPSAPRASASSTASSCSIPMIDEMARASLDLVVAGTQRRGDDG